MTFTLEKTNACRYGSKEEGKAMKNLIQIIEKITDLGPDVTFKFHQQSLSGAHWRGEIEVSYTDMFDKADFDTERQIPAIARLYVMEEYSPHPQRVIENLTRRLSEVYDKLPQDEEDN